MNKKQTKTASETNNAPKYSSPATATMSDLKYVAQGVIDAAEPKSELLKCPFCGGSAVLTVHEDEPKTKHSGWHAHVSCWGCFVQQPVIGGESEQHARERAVARWNKRV